MATTETEKLLQRITELEAETQAQRSKIEDAESELSAAFETGGDTTKLQRQVSDARDHFDSLVTALNALDAKVIDVSRKENSEARAALKSEATEHYERNFQTIASGIRKLRSQLSKIVEADQADRVIKRTIDAAATELWSIANDYFDRHYLERVPQVVTTRTERDENGNRLRQHGYSWVRESDGAFVRKVEE